MSILELRNLTKVFKDLRAVDNANLIVNEGEFFVIFGPSGAGKTTTLKLIAGLEDPSEGNVIIDGRNINNVVPEKRNVAYTFENYALYPHMSVYDNISYPLKAPGRLMDRTAIKKRVDYIVQMLRIDNLLNRFPSQLSGGQKQRVALARSLVRSADVYLLDEPLSHVDAKVRHEMRREFHSLKSALLSTTVYVTHDYMEAIALGDRMAVLSEGRILQCDSPREIWYNPLSREIASLVSAPKMNIIEGQVVGESTGGESTDQMSVMLSNKVKIAVPQKLRMLLSRRQRIAIGIRPNAIQAMKEKPHLDIAFKSKVRVLEVLSADLLLTTDSNGLELRIVQDHEIDFNQGEEIMVGWNISEMFWFDVDTGKNISHHSFAE